MQTIKIPNMVLIGATGRNVGKTTLACALIRRLRQAFPVIAVKVTTVDTRQGPCPRGGSGCGVCAALQGDFEITEESQCAGTKDTQLMRQAQATRVYWIKALRTHLPEAIGALIKRVGRECVIVCESTGLRTCVEPGLFLLTDRASITDPRSSAQQVRHLANRVLCFDGRGFDVCVDHITYDGMGWHCPAAAACIVLAGGTSRRMGQDKCLLPVGGGTLLRYVLKQVTTHFDDIIVSANGPHSQDFPSVKVVADIEKGRGPLMGIYSALQASRFTQNFVVACDIPVIDIALAQSLVKLARDYDAVIPRSGPGHCEPLFAVYNRSLLGAMARTLAQGRNRILDALEHCNVCYVDLSTSQVKSLLNLNTPGDYRRFLGRRQDSSEPPAPSCESDGLVT